jgi:hypothetical protein
MRLTRETVSTLVHRAVRSGFYLTTVIAILEHLTRIHM